MSATGSPAPRRADAGFTLFELLVAVAIMSLAAGLAFPALQRVNARRTLDTAQRAMSVAIVTARAEALARGRVVALAPDAGAPDTLVANGKVVAKLPAGVRVNWPGERPLYYPDGSARGAMLSISAEGATRQIDPVLQP